MTNSFDPTRYHSLSIDGYELAGSTYRGHYSLNAANPDDDRHFTETIDFGTTLPAGQPDVRLLSLLTLTVSLSYFKMAAPPRIHIRFPVHEFETHYLRELARGGLSEFAYRNNLPQVLDVQVDGPPADRYDPAFDDFDADQPPLVPIGGGKDSIVTVESLKAHGFEPVLFSVNHFEPIERCIRISGLSSLRVNRTIDPGVIEANAQGAYNGHIPVTAINSVLALIAADSNGLGPVVMSNERSSNTGNMNWLGFDVNHQWSKSIVYETLLREALGGYGLNADRYFSLLRPLSESQIADRFRSCTRYFNDFVSCNRPFALDPSKRHASWCGTCPKCLFVFVLLAPRLGRARTESIFGHNLLAVPDNAAGFRDLLGLGRHKPFECVGEYHEAAESLLTVISQAEWRGVALVEEFRADSEELARVASVETAAEPAADYVPERYRESLGDSVRA